MYTLRNMFLIPTLLITPLALGAPTPGSVDALPSTHRDSHKGLSEAASPVAFEVGGDDDGVNLLFPRTVRASVRDMGP